jgi:phosphatidylserine/phosphatidylglycerophosphate/cardiolipin synthase-like enzyme
LIDRAPLGFAAFALALLLAGCASLPPLEGRPTTVAFSDTSQTRLGRALADDVAAHPGKTGIHPLSQGSDAFATRVLLARAADRSLDAQYYIWSGDQVGYLLFEALWEAAERGVRVRLLLDDLNTGGLDATIAALESHPNIEVRLYNPLVERNARLLNFVTDFTRVNRRMHNKSFTVDNQVSVVGGRNIGNEYFGAGSGILYTDLDVVATGTAVREVSKEFDLYWNSASAYPAASFVGAAGADSAVALKARFAATREDPEAVAYLEAVRTTPVVRDILERKLALEWTTAQVVYDDPAKTLETSASSDVLLFPELVEAMGRPERSLELVSPYFVPGEGGTAALVALARRGVSVRVLTNSLAATDVVSVHAGYDKRRRELLAAGVKLYELKPTAMRELRDGTSAAPAHAGSTSALHAKTFAVDRRRIFIGSFNFDQRSAHINTEMGLVIESPPLAERLASAFDVEIPRTAWEPKLAADGGSIEWIERTATSETRYDVEPATSWSLRGKVQVLAILPIEWLL